MTKNNNEFIFKKHDSIGVSAAEDDEKFLLNCFIDTGDFSIVEDFGDPRCLILGRTGMGKTALLTKLKDEKKDKDTVIIINPESLAMQHISNSPIIKNLDKLDIDLNTFYKLLWRHSVCVEIFSHHFKIYTQSEQDTFIEQLRFRFRKSNPKHLRALNYMQEWKDTFWKEDNSHVQKMLNRTEQELGSKIGTDIPGFNALVEGKKKTTEELTTEIKERAQSIVNDVQMKEVNDLIDMLNEVIEDQQKKYYVIIDKLDDRWVEDSLRYRLIKSLIETVQELNRCNNIKPLVVLRQDLLGHVFDITKDTGFQEEKFSSLFLPIHWTRSELKKLLDERVNYSFQSRYRKKHDVVCEDVMVKKIGKFASIDYILDRTLLRPRDAISFFNLCISAASETALITEDMVLDAERTHSRQRLEALYFEWYIEFPRLETMIKMLQRKKDIFFAGSLTKEILTEVAIKCIETHVSVDGDKFYETAKNYIDNKVSSNEFRNYLLCIFFQIGLLGVQLKGQTKPKWSYQIKKILSAEDIGDDSTFYVHPCFISALNVG
jgi:hypothetical protein